MERCLDNFSFCCRRNQRYAGLRVNQRNEEGASTRWERFGEAMTKQIKQRENEEREDEISK